MKSPFPGMDPYLEAHGGDVHTRLIVYACDQLRPQLPSDLRARVEEYVSVQAEDADVGGFYPDVRVIERPGSVSTAGTAVETLVAEPVVVPLYLEPETLRSIRIVDRQSGDRVVTAIEILSPSNKLLPSGRADYLKKQQELFEAGVNLVEIDLLRSGPHVLLASLAAFPVSHRKPYRICVYRAARPGRAEVYRTSLREPLPTIRIPLRETDPDVRLNLQALIDQAYANGGYEDIDYRTDPSPPLEGDDAAWADARLREQGRW